MIERGHKAVLLGVARDSIRERLKGVDVAGPRLDDCPARLQQPGASFVTLTVNRALRGCIGSIAASRPLIDDVWSNAQRAAFADPRFPPLAESEAPRAGLEIAVLGPLERLAVSSEAELLETLRPGVDGLLIRFGDQRATFLPKVWDSLSEPADFLGHLKRKMGQADDFWDASVIVERYQSEEFAGPLIP